MVRVAKDKIAKVTYIGDVCNGSCDSFYHSRSGNLFSVHRKLDNIKEISDLEFTEFEGVVNDTVITFNNANDLDSYLTSELTSEIILGQEHLDAINAHPIYYKPTVVVTDIDTTVVSINTNSIIKLDGNFLDYVNSITFTGVNGFSQQVVILNSNSTYLEIQITADNIEQFYSLTLVSPNNTLVFQVEALNQTITIPDNDVITPALWVKPPATNNNAILSNGTFEVPLVGSNNGWNDHAYFGPFTASNFLNYEMVIERLTGASNAYCFIRFNTTNNVSTGGNPRIYIQNGYTLNMYNNAGASTNNTVAVGDKIEVKFTPTTMKVLKNGVEIMTHTAVYNLTNLYVNYSAYRVFKATNIKVITN